MVAELSTTAWSWTRPVVLATSRTSRMTFFPQYPAPMTAIRTGFATLTLQISLFCGRFSDEPGDRVDFLFCAGGVNRQAEHLSRQSLCYGEQAFGVSVFFPVWSLKVNRHRIVDGRLYPVLLEMRCELVSACAPNYEQVINWCFFRRLCRGQHYAWGAFQSLSVQVSDSSSSLVPGVQLSQLDSPDGSVYCVKSRCVTNPRHRIF